jgi:hypothetical protein
LNQNHAKWLWKLLEDQENWLLSLVPSPSL